MYRVVLVDDEQMIVNGLKKAFPWAKYQCEVVATANDGTQGLLEIQKHHPHIVITDIRMPNVDGLQMVAALHSEYPHMQVSVLTAYRDFDYAQRAMHLGVSRFLLKPSKMDEIHEAVKHMTEQLSALAQEEEPEPETAEPGNFVARAALQYIRDHYTEHISLNDVAQSVYVSPWHLSKLINGHLGQGFFEILNSLRIQKAKTLLMEPELKVHEIAQAVGYGDVAHFSKIFKKITGVSPMEYRSGKTE